MNPYVRSVKANAPHHLELLFENGEWRLFDMSRYLKIGVLDVAVILVTLGLVALALWL